MNPQDLYTKIQQQVREDARQVAMDVYTNMGTKFNVPEVPVHVHTGVDTNQIQYKSIIQGNKYVTTIIVFDNGGPLTQTFTLGGISNPSRIFFQGFAANNADATPATKRAILNGEINFGTCFLVSALTLPLVLVTSGPGIPFIQSSNAMYVDSTNLANNRVSTSALDWIHATDETGAVIAQATAITYNNQLGILTITFTVGVNWKIQGAFTIT